MQGPVREATEITEVTMERSTLRLHLDPVSGGILSALFDALEELSELDEEEWGEVPTEVLGSARRKGDDSEEPTEVITWPPAFPG